MSVNITALFDWSFEFFGSPALSVLSMASSAAVFCCHFVMSRIVYPRVLFVFFFFQAEDGIRDSSVTGVQTCALPICTMSPPTEAVNVLLPVASVGGDIVRARLLNFGGVSGGVAVASASVDLLLEAAAQALFALIGIALLMQVASGTEIASWPVGGVETAALALAGF